MQVVRITETAFVRDLGSGWRKKAEIGVPKKPDTFSRLEIEGLYVAVSQRETVFAVVFTAWAGSSWLMPWPLSVVLSSRICLRPNQLDRQ